MKTYVSCYSKPLSEFSIPVDDEKYNVFGRKEIDNWLQQLKRTFPFSAKDFHIKEHFSEKYNKVEYWEVILEYEDSKLGQELAFAIVEELPYEWDDKSKSSLGKEYFDYTMRLKCPKDFPKQSDPFQEKLEDQQ